jgi:ubiquinone/menaquinone biosynthesis C-methylase UbiE
MPPRRNANELGFEVNGRPTDAETLPYGDDSFDLVIGQAVIHHIPDVERAFTEMLRVLKPGGRVVICGEPTRYGDYVARRLSRLTWAVTTRLTALFTRHDGVPHAGSRGGARLMRA